MKHTKISMSIIAILFGVSLTTAYARPFRVAQIPNGSVNRCANCHINPAGGGPRNAFGEAVEAGLIDRNVDWGPALASLDSDGDGATNGQELQDPTGAWQSEQDQPGNLALVTKPGDPNSMPGQVAGLDNIPPQAVTGITAVDTPDDEGGSITLSWELSADDAAVTPFSYGGYVISRGGVAKYNIYRSSAAEAEALIATVTPGTKEYVDTTVETGREYTYTVKAADFENEADPVIGEGSPEDLARKTRAEDNKKPVDAAGKEIEGLFGPDSKVDLNDFHLLADNFGMSQEDPQFEPAFDLTEDGKVDLEDFFVFLENWGREAVSP